MKMFASDNCSGIHPNIIKAIAECNEEHDFPYGSDSYTKRAKEAFRHLFGEASEVFFVTNGTGANVLGLSSMLKTYEGVICAQSAHINNEECGAFEKYTGSKLLLIAHKDGKIKIEDIKICLKRKGNEHFSQPKVISISQATEFGTLYTIEEIRELAEFAHSNNMLLHVDGSRITNACAALGVSFKEMVTDTGVDLLSFGGTKNGMLFGDAIISLNKECSESLRFIRKQGMQLISKMRFVSAQFLAYLENELWRETASHSIEMAKLLEKKLIETGKVEIVSPVEINIIFAKIKKEYIKELQNLNYFNIVDEDEGLVRLVTSFNTSEEEIIKFCDVVK